MKQTVIAFAAVFAAALLACCSGEQKPAGSAGKSGDMAAAPVVPVVNVESRRLDTTIQLPGELKAYQDVALHAKVEGYISWIGVDRGSLVHKGQPLIIVTAPELDAKVHEAVSHASAADSAYRQAISALEGMRSKRVEAIAKLEADQLTSTRLEGAAKTPGAVAQNEVDVANKAVEGDNARVRSLQAEVAAAKNLVASQMSNKKAAENMVQSIKAMRSYLTIKAPFDGVITERNVHQGSIVAVESTRAGTPLLRIQEVDVLRLVVAVPESSVAGVELGDKIPFIVPAFLGKTFYGTVARPAYALDNTTRTMPVELSVPNQTRQLEPGMFATVAWRVTRPYDTLFVPQSALGNDLKGAFVVRVAGGRAERVSVKQGQTMGHYVEVMDSLNPGDQVVLKASDELRTGSKLIAKLADRQDIEAAGSHTSAGGE